MALGAQINALQDCYSIPFSRVTIRSLHQPPVKGFFAPTALLKAADSTSDAFNVPTVTVFLFGYWLTPKFRDPLCYCSSYPSIAAIA
jgi:hypothetical protein